ncbi:MAG: glycosyltransferase [Sphingomicrobium sp.]
MDADDHRPVILLLLNLFRPSLRANGPNRAAERTVASLSDRFRFRVVSVAEAGDPIGCWHELGGCERIALAPGRPFARGLVELLRATPHDLIVCNSLFDPTLTLPTLLARRLGLIRSPLLVAPHGELYPGALGLKPLRKRIFRLGARLLGLLRPVRLQGTDAREAAQISILFPDLPLSVGPNIRPLDPLPPHALRAPGELLRIAFLSRIDRMKNLDFALDLLARSDIAARFDIYGPITDAGYWRECRDLIDRMPANIVVAYRGEVAPEEVGPTLARHDLFLLPTRGENFGYAIADSLIAGTPVLIADTTPWRGLAAAEAGAELSLGDPAAWQDWIEAYSRRSSEKMARWRSGARAFAEAHLDPAADIDQLTACYSAAIEAGRASD